MSIPDRFILEIDRALHPEHYGRYPSEDLRSKPTGSVPHYRAYLQNKPLTTEQKLSATLYLVNQIKELELSLLKLAIDTAAKLKEERSTNEVCSND